MNLGILEVLTKDSNKNDYLLVFEYAKKGDPIENKCTEYVRIYLYLIRNKFLDTE